MASVKGVPSPARWQARMRAAKGCGQGATICPARMGQLAVWGQALAEVVHACTKVCSQGVLQLLR